MAYMDKESKAKIVSAVVQFLTQAEARRKRGGLSQGRSRKTRKKPSIGHADFVKSQHKKTGA